MVAERSYKNILKEELTKRCEKNPRFSIRAFAKTLEIDPGALSRILTGKQIPSFKVSRQILSKLDLPTDQEEEFLCSIVETQKNRGLQRMSPEFRSVVTKELSAKLQQRDLSIDMYRVIADWYHIAILELTFTQGFQSDPVWIAKELGITRTEAKLAVERLLDLELLSFENGKLVKTEVQLTTTDKKLTTPALRKNQRQYLEKAIGSLENDPIESRSHTSMTMAIDPSKLKEAKKLIRDFNRSMCLFLESGKQKQVYNLQVALYPLQKTKEK